MDNHILVYYKNDKKIMLENPMPIFVAESDNYKVQGNIRFSDADREYIRLCCVKRGNISEAELARRVGVTPQNFNNKMKRDNFSERDLQEIADALGLRLEITFVDPETGEKV